MEFKRFVTFCRTHTAWIISVCVFLLGTFVLTRFLNFFISPDETATAFFVHAFAQNGSFRVFDGMNALYGSVLHPRSILVDGSYLVPGSFLGVAFLYGVVTRLIGAWSLTFLTPVIVVLAALAWNQLVKKWFSVRVAFLSAILFLFHPAVWYYSARGLMPNVLLTCCIIFAAYFLLRYLSPHRGESMREVSRSGGVSVFLAGLFLGLSLFIRLSELYWLVPLFAFLLFLERKSISRKQFVYFLFGIMIPIGLMLFLNDKTYGSPFTTGYTFVSEVSPTLTGVSTPVAKKDLLSILLPFGFHPRGVFWHTWDYLLMLFWWLTIPAVCAIPSLVRHKKTRIYFFVTLAIAAWLCVWYGSWKLRDNPDPTQITIANSYIRYWLPIFVLSTPLIATTLVWIADRAKTKRIASLVALSCILLLISLNTRIVFLEGPDALHKVVSVLEDSKRIRARVLEIVPATGVLVVDRSDKLFFPARHVMVPLRADQTFAAMPKIADQTSLYYYGITLPPSDTDFLNQQKLGPLGLRIEFIESFGVESLYRIIRP
jgi:hypothetical protein